MALDASLTISVRLCVPTDRSRAAESLTSPGRRAIARRVIPERSIHVAATRTPSRRLLPPSRRGALAGGVERQINAAGERRGPIPNILPVSKISIFETEMTLVQPPAGLGGRRLPCVHLTSEPSKTVVLGPILPRWGRRHVPTMSPLYVPTVPFHRTSGDGCRWRPVSFRRIVSSISRWTGRGGNQGDALWVRSVNQHDIVCIINSFLLIYLTRA